MTAGKLSRLFVDRTRHVHSKRRFSSSLPPINPSNPFVGVWPIIATPFNNATNESINYTAFEKIIDFFSNTIHVNGLTIIGVLGESNRLMDSERTDLTRIACGISSKPICVGTSHSGTLATIKLSEDAFINGAHSVMITPSKEPVPDSNAILEYYTQICAALSAEQPIVVQDHPASTQVFMPLPLLQQIVDECAANVKCIKLESLPSPPRIHSLLCALRGSTATSSSTPPNKDVNILTGLGALYGMFDLEAGTDGFMTGFAFPEILQAMCAEYIVNHDVQKARDIYSKYLPIIVYEQQPGIGVRKEIYKLRGLMEDTHVRHPGKSCSPYARQQLQNWIEHIFHDQLLTHKLLIK